MPVRLVIGSTVGVGGMTVGVDTNAGSTNTAFSISNTGSPSSVFNGSNVVYTITPDNTGSVSATSVSLVVTLDSHATYVSSVNTGWTFGQVGQVLTFTIASLATGSATPITVTASLANTGTTNVTAITSAQISASNSTNSPTANASTTVVPTDTLSISASGSVSAMLNGAALAYTINVTNNGSVSATAPQVAITIDNNLTYVSGSGTGWSFVAVGQVVTASAFTMAPGPGNAITINVTAANGANASANTSMVATATNSTNSPSTSVATSLYVATRDATSNIVCPASSTEWANVLTVAGVGSGGPSFLWLCQESSGNLNDSISTATLTASGTAVYSTAVTGWSRKAISYADASAARFTRTTTPLPNGNASSMLLIVYQYVSSAPAATRQLGAFGNATSSLIECTTTGHYEVVCGSNNATGATSPFNGAIHPLVLKHDLTNSIAALYTDIEKVAPTYAALSGIGMYLTGASTTPAGGTLYATLFAGSAAELSDASVKAIMTTLGWSQSGW